MLYMAAFAACLAFTQVVAYLSAAVLLIAICLLNFVLSVRIWRHLTYGALLGVVSAFIAASVYARMASGVTGPPNYQSMSLVSSYFDPLRPYLFPMGSFLGGSMGMLLYNMNRKPVDSPSL